jgi:hypothetical protein
VGCDDDDYYQMKDMPVMTITKYYQSKTVATKLVVRWDQPLGDHVFSRK